MKTSLMTLVLATFSTISFSQEAPKATLIAPAIIENVGEVNVGYGKYGDYQGFTLGFDKKLGKLTLGIAYQNTDHKDDILTNQRLNIHSIRDTREDFSLKAGYEIYHREYSKMAFSVSPFASLGLSKYDQYQHRGTRPVTCEDAHASGAAIESCFFKMTPDLAKKKMMKVELGIKLELALDKVSDDTIIKRDLNPYIEIKHQQYGKSDNNFGATIGLTAGF